MHFCLGNRAMAEASPAGHIILGLFVARITALNPVLGQNACNELPAHGLLRRRVVSHPLARACRCAPC
jgi:hypothetical protein